MFLEQSLETGIEPVLRRTLFVWSARSGMLDLNTLIPANSGWELEGAVAVNVGGQIIGAGMINGQQHEFLLTPQCVL